VHSYATSGRRVWSRAAALFALSVLIAGCGGPVSAPSAVDSGAQRDQAKIVYDEIATLAEGERTERLVEMAKQEGGLNLYGTGSLEAQGDAFSDKYGIKVNFYEADTDTVASRIIQEARAGKYSADVFNGGATLMEELDANQLLGTYESAFRDEVPADGKSAHWTAYYRQPLIVLYNLNLVDPAELPHDVLGFADPKWAGRISMELGDYDWYMTLVGYYEDQGMSREEIDEKFTAMARNAKVIDGHSEQAGLLAAGQFGVAVSAYTLHAARFKNEGAPLTFGGNDGNPAVQPVAMRYEAVALMAHAPHPAAATLFLDFVLGPEGSQLTLDQGQLPAAPMENDPLADSTVVLIDNDEYVNNGDKWAEDYDAILRNATR
jgi:iron(III) transport system substrate-binding protein